MDVCVLQRENVHPEADRGSSGGAHAAGDAKRTRSTADAGEAGEVAAGGVGGTVRDQNLLKPKTFQR